jgi:adenylate cyclase class 2
METEKEFEAKFLLSLPNNIRQSLLDMGGRVLVPRVLERNLRFDINDGFLSANKKVLRLRQDNLTTLTYKFSKSIEERIEIEIEVDNFRTTRGLLQALGYNVVFTYEKYRETFLLDPVHIMLDELPFGHFMEIEGTSLKMVERAATALGMQWEIRIKRSYMELFDVLAQNLDLTFSDATFANFANMNAIKPMDLGLDYAIRSQTADESET